MPTEIEFRHGHLFCGLGGGAKGFNDAQPRVGNLVGRFRCIGGIDVDPAAIADFEQMTGVRGTVMDLFDRDQYVAFHGHQPPAGWREATPADIHRAFGFERPNIVFLSAPCKGFSGLLSESKSKTEKYQALNRLTVRGVWLMLEAWRDDPPELVLFENVPRIATRGRHLLDQIVGLLRAYGYAVAETTHDCGEIGGLAQSRKRFLLVARHQEKVPPFLYQPDRRPLRAVGDVLGRMPLPGDPCAGAMHRVPSLQWKTWVRLAFVEAGSDWRSLNKLAVQDGVLRDFLIVPEMHGGALGVRGWGEPCGVVAGASRPHNGAFSVADPRALPGAAQYAQYGVNGWCESTGAVIGVKSPGQGAFSVADPRQPGQPFAKYAVTAFDGAAGTVISGSTTGQGAFAVADPRAMHRGKGDHYLTGGHYGVVPWNGTAGAVSASACHDNGAWSVADPRVGESVRAQAEGQLPAPGDKLIAVIRALDGTWHRPFTTLELAALQSLLDPEEAWVPWRLHGESNQAHRERIGNAVPRHAARAIAEVMGETLLLARAGETFLLSSRPVWVRPVAIALSVQGAV